MRTKEQGVSISLGVPDEKTKNRKVVVDCNGCDSQEEVTVTSKMIKEAGTTREAALDKLVSIDSGKFFMRDDKFLCKFCSTGGG